MVKGLAQGHPFCKWQRQDSNVVPLAPKPETVPWLQKTLTSREEKSGRSTPETGVSPKACLQTWPLAGPGIRSPRTGRRGSLGRNRGVLGAQHPLPFWAAGTPGRTGRRAWTRPAPVSTWALSL